MKRQTSNFYEKHATYFITTTITKFTPIFYEEELANILLKNLKFYLNDFKANLHAFVIMPNHIHLLLTIGTKGNISQLMGRFKEFSAKQIIEWCRKNNKIKLLKTFSQSAKKYKPLHKHQVWQERFDDLLIYSEKIFNIKFDYIHNNPIQEQWQLVESPEDYKFSSARFYFDNTDVGVPIKILE